MTHDKPTFTEACQQLSHALGQVWRVLVPTLPVFRRLTLQVLQSAIPRPAQRLMDAWVNALLIVIVGGLIALWLAVLVATYAGWI